MQEGLLSLSCSHGPGVFQDKQKREKDSRTATCRFPANSTVIHLELGTMPAYTVPPSLL